MRQRWTSRGKMKPKQLDTEPSLFDGGTGGAGPLGVLDRHLRPPPRRRPPGQASVTDDEGVGADRSPPEPDPATVALAREMAAMIAVPRPPPPRRRRVGGADVVSAPFRDGSSDIDLDRTLDTLAERRPLAAADITMRERRGRRRTVVLAVDVSGSVDGPRLTTAAATVGAMSAALARERFAVVAFWSDAALVLGPDEDCSLDELVARILGLHASGLTNVAFPLQVARDLLAGVPAADTRVIVLSDCLHNAGPDPVGPASALTRVDVLLDTTAEHDKDIGREVARAGRGLVIPVCSPTDVVGAMETILL